MPADRQADPFFVIGSPRSGTTMLRLMLTAHPRLVVPPECGFVAWLYPRFGAWSADDFADTTKRAQFVAEICASRKFETWQLSSAEIERALTLAAALDFGRACDAIYRLFAVQKRKPSVTCGDKNNHYLECISTLKSIFPRSRFLHIVRDGRDVACSYREVMAAASESPYRPSLPVRLDDIANRWAGDVRCIRRQVSALEPDAYVELRYEDLVRDPYAELTRICEWLGVPFALEMLAFHELNRSENLEPKLTMDWKRRTLDPASSETVGRYAKVLSAAEIREFVAIAGAELDNFGYPR